MTKALRTAPLPRRVRNGRHVGQIWRLSTGGVGMIVDSGCEGGWFIQDTHDNEPFLVDYDSAFLAENITPADNRAPPTDRIERREPEQEDTR